RGVALELGREPGGTPAADMVRALFATPPPGEAWLPLTELYLVAAARAQHLGVRVRPVLASGRWFLCDRFNDSSRVYQGVLGGLPSELVERVLEGATGGLEPSLTFLLDCDVTTAMQRVATAAASESAERATAVLRYDRRDAEFHQ